MNSKIALVVALFAFAPGVVHAEEATPAPAPAAMAPPASQVTTAPTESRWYGLRLLAVDGATLGTLVIVASANRVSSSMGGSNHHAYALGYAALGAWLVGGPVVHGLTSGLTYRVPVSLALRLGLPLGGALALWTLADNPNDHSDTARSAPVVAGALGLLGGIVVADVLDVAWLARDEVPSTTASVSVAPFIQELASGRRSATGLALAATF
jgi:hypothetical protein